MIKPKGVEEGEDATDEMKRREKQAEEAVAAYKIREKEAEEAVAAFKEKAIAAFKAKEAERMTRGGTTPTKLAKQQELEERDWEREREEDDEQISQERLLEHREREAEEAIAVFKAKEAERLAKEKAEAEAKEKEFQHLMQEQLINSGLDEKAIAAILKREKIKPEQAKEEKANDVEEVVARPTYTRMSLQYLSLETLYFYEIDFERDSVSSTPEHTPPPVSRM